MNDTPLTAENVGDFFAAMTESYDSLIRRAVPRYAEMTERLVHYMPDRATRVLELGCGTGNLSLALVNRFPGARFTFVDAADEMLLVTRQRIANRDPETAAHAAFVASRFEQLALTRGEYDLIASAISLHHVADKQSLFAALHPALVSGGSFCFSDQMRAEPPYNNQRNWEEWLAFCRLPGNCTEEEIASLLAHAQAHDHYETPGDHLRQLGRTGFRHGDCLWRSGMWAIIVATA